MYKRSTLRNTAVTTARTDNSTIHRPTIATKLLAQFSDYCFQLQSNHCIPSGNDILWLVR